MVLKRPWDSWILEIIFESALNAARNLNAPYKKSQIAENPKINFENSKIKWELEYTEKKSLTNEDSFLINIKKIKRV